MRDWTGALDLPPLPPLYKEGDRILVRTPDRDVVMVVDEVFEPDVDGVRRATMHQEDADDADLYYAGHDESPAQPEG